MEKLFRKICCLVLAILLFVGFSQVSKAAILEDEGTEGNASEYTTWHGMTVSNANPGSTKVGSQALKVQKTSNVGRHSAAYRPLSTSFQWKDFISCTLWIYRPSGHFTAPDDTLHFGFLKYHEIHAPGQSEYISIGSQPADTWVQYIVTKEMLEEHDHYDGLRDSDTVVDMFWRFSAKCGDPRNFVYVDGLTKDGTSERLQESGSTPSVFTSEQIWYLFGGIGVITVVISLMTLIKTGRLSLRDPMKEGIILIEQQGRISIKSLAKKLNLSEEVVRRKIDIAVRKGKISGTFTRNGSVFLTTQALEKELLKFFRRQTHEAD